MRDGRYGKRKYTKGEHVGYTLVFIIILLGISIIVSGIVLVLRLML